MQKLRYDSILRRLRKEGYGLNEFSMVSEGEYSAEDADWNYKDVPHLPVVHRLADTSPIVVGDDIICTINLQNILGIWYPITVVNYELEKNRQIYYTTLFFFVLAIQTVIEEAEPLRTKVTTTYNIAYPRWLFFVVPALKWLVKRNYKVLMSEDLPMRERRGELRKLGYRFTKQGDTYGFLETMNIFTRHVKPPAGADYSHTFNYHDALNGQPECFVGDRGLLGLRLSREGDTVSVWPRACPHEGASLDASGCKKGEVLCPWHGRRFTPIGTFTWNQDAEFQSDDYAIRVSGKTVSWRYQGDAAQSTTVSLRANLK